MAASARSPNTLVATAQLNGVDPKALLADVLRHVADHLAYLHELLRGIGSKAMPRPLPSPNPPQRAWPDIHEGHNLIQRSATHSTSPPEFFRVSAGKCGSTE